MADASVPPPTERPAPTNVIQAIARVMEEMPAVGKDAQYSGGGSGSYSYRSIEAVTAAAQKLMGRYCVVPIPKVVERVTTQLTINGKPWTQEELTLIYTVYGPGGIEDKIELGPLVALGRDNTDKGTNKAMTQAFKQGLVQMLVIGDGKDDGDSDRHEADDHGQRRPEGPPPAQTEGWPNIEAEAAAHKGVNDQIKQLKALLPDDHPVLASIRKYREDNGWPMAAPALTELSMKVAKAHGAALDAKAKEEGAPPTPAEPPSEAAAPAPEAPSAVSGPPGETPVLERLCPWCDEPVVGPKVITGGKGADDPIVYWHKDHYEAMQAEQAPPPEDEG